MGSVWLAEDTLLKRSVTLKELVQHAMIAIPKERPRPPFRGDRLADITLRMLDKDPARRADVQSVLNSSRLSASWPPRPAIGDSADSYAFPAARPA